MVYIEKDLDREVPKEENYNNEGRRSHIHPIPILDPI